MLTTLIALHLVAAQAAAEPPPAPERAAPSEAAPPPAAPGGAEPAAAPPTPAPAEEEALKPAREQPAPTTMKARTVVKSALNPIPTLFSAEPLSGRSVVEGWAGWSSLGAGWAQGITDADDLGVVGDFDWSTAELRLSAYYRRPLGRAGLFQIASRLRAGWWADFGWRWFHDDNLGDRGIEFVPGIVVSTRGAGGVFSFAGDLPLTVTLWRTGGLFAAPKASFAYETLLYGDLTIGIRVAGAYRAGSGDAAMRDPRGLLELQVIAGRRLF